MTGTSRDPLYVDLDGTLILSDVFVESVLALIKSNPLAALLLPVWLIRGKAYLKDQVARRVSLDVSLLPYHRALLEFLREERARGRSLILITASDRRHAAAVADHLGIFAESIGSDGVTNLSAHRKLGRILSDNEKGNFAYAGNSVDDLAVWPEAAEAIVVGASARVLREARAGSNVSHVYDRSTVKQFWPHTLGADVWLGNLVLFLSLLFVSEGVGWPVVIGAVAAYCVIGLTGSSLFLTLQLFRLDDDRKNPAKQDWRVASGHFSIVRAIVVAAALALSAGTFSLLMATPPFWLVVMYVTIGVIRAVWVRPYTLTDNGVDALMTTTCLLVGAVMTNAQIPYWFYFLVYSIAFARRLYDVRARGGVMKER